MIAAKVLEEAGYETIIFHAVGTGGRAMERMMQEGLIGAVLDFATIEVSNDMHHALLAGGSEPLRRSRGWVRRLACRNPTCSTPWCMAVIGEVSARFW